MNDRELLELAAKAAGAEFTDYSDRTPDHWIIEHADGVWRKWKPLYDDGDSLRLAVKLRMDIEIRICAGYVAVSAYREPDDLAHAVETPGDSAESLRRAITRAAAEIGARITTEDGK